MGNSACQRSEPEAWAPVDPSKQTRCHADRTGHRDMRGSLFALRSCGDSSIEGARQQQQQQLHRGQLFMLSGSRASWKWVHIPLCRGRHHRLGPGSQFTNPPRTKMVLGNESSSLMGEVKLARFDRRHRFVRRRTGSDRQTQACTSCREEGPSLFIVAFPTNNPSPRHGQHISITI